MGIPARVQQRLTNSLKKFQPILADAKKRDVNESDTVTLVVDLLSYLFGYDKYAEITSEHAIKGTYVDLAIKMDDQVQILIEVKSIGTTLDERHTKQAVDYAANQGVDWVVLTNGNEWHIYKVIFGKPLTQEVVSTFDILALNTKKASDLEQLWPLCKRGLLRSVLEEYHQQRQATSKYLLAAVVLSDPVVQRIRTEVRRVSNILISPEELVDALTHNVLKREVTDGDAAKEATKRVRKGQKRTVKKRTLKPKAPEPSGEIEATEEVAASIASPSTSD